jgi:D-3-phosphoglycerate dehydrogenase
MGGVRRLRSQTVGVVGFGRIGQALARKVKPLVARVVAYDALVPSAVMGEQGIEAQDFPTLLHLSDYVSLHCPLTPETRHLFNAHSLAQMKPTAWLINTARGEIIDEAALAASLSAGRLGGAALDVLTQEPPPEDHPLLRLDNVILTSHIAFFSKEALLDLQRLAAEEARRILTGEPPRSPVNADLLGRRDG